MGWLSNIGDKVNLFDGTNKCKKRGRAFYVGDPGKIIFAENLCEQSNPGQYQSKANFEAEFYRQNPELKGTNQQSEEEAQEAIENRNKALKIAGISVVVIVFGFLLVRWINKK